MQKNVVFESERYTRWQNLKPYVLTGAVILGALLIAVIVALILRGGRTASYAGGGDSPYPYVWSENRDGSVTLELDRSAAPGYDWQATDPQPELTVKTARAGEGKTRFSLEPQGQGRTAQVFSLLPENGGEDPIYELTVLLETEETEGRRSTRLVSAAGRALAGRLESAGEAAIPYTIRSDGDGRLLIAVEISRELIGSVFSWECVSEDEAVVRTMGVLSSSGAVTAYLAPGDEAGTVEARMQNDELGAVITAVCQVSEAGELTVLSHSFTQTEPVVSGE